VSTSTFQLTYFEPTRDNIRALCWFSNIKLYYYLCRLLSVCSIFIMLRSVFKVEFVLNLTGSTTGAVICFIIPALIHLSLISKSSENKTMSKVSCTHIYNNLQSKNFIRIFVSNFLICSRFFY
jgi:hypothetical protein